VSGGLAGVRRGRGSGTGHRTANAARPAGEQGGSAAASVTYDEPEPSLCSGHTQGCAASAAKRRQPGTDRGAGAPHRGGSLPERRLPRAGWLRRWSHTGGKARTPLPPSCRRHDRGRTQPSLKGRTGDTKT